MEKAPIGGNVARQQNTCSKRDGYWILEFYGAKVKNVPMAVLVKMRRGLKVTRVHGPRPSGDPPRLENRPTIREGG